MPSICGNQMGSDHGPCGSLPMERKFPPASTAVLMT